MAVIKKTANAGKGAGKKISWTLFVSEATLEITMAVPQKLKVLLYDPPIPLLGICLK
jgi:hypothetical protein